jgi:hypothetical protein
MKRLITVFFLGSVALLAQDVSGISTVTLGLGGGWQTGLAALGSSGGGVFNGRYEYRLAKYVAVEAGVSNTLTTFYGSSASILAGTSLTQFTFFNLSSRTNGRDTAIPVGFRGILPVKTGKVELFANLDGGFIWQTGQSYEGWLIQSGLGARFAVDKQRHFWMGTSANYMHEFGSGTQNWITWTADLSFRFGR